MWRFLFAVLLATGGKAQAPDSGRCCPILDCGQPAYPPLTRVVNGEDARPYSWPWQISLQIGLGDTWYHNCGGSLITPDWVLTAGHCIMTYFNTRVVLGEYNLSVEEGPEQYIPVNPEDMHVHPDWDLSSLYAGNDIALVKLSRSAVLNDKVKLGCVPCEGSLLPNDYPCYVTGWGSTISIRWVFPRHITAGSAPRGRPRALLTARLVGREGPGNVVCAGGDIRSACHGDSGGPLSCKHDDGKWYVHGIVSWGNGTQCNTLKKPTVFTRTSAFIPWIKEIINNH